MAEPQEDDQDDGYCHCPEPATDPTDEEAFCMRCRRFLDEDD